MQDDKRLKHELGCLKAYRDKDKAHEEKYEKELYGDKHKMEDGY